MVFVIELSIKLEQEHRDFAPSSQVHNLAIYNFGNLQNSISTIYYFVNFQFWQFSIYLGNIQV